MEVYGLGSCLNETSNEFINKIGNEYEANWYNKYK